MKYKWKYVNGLEPMTKSINLSLGEVLHKGFDLFYSGVADKDVRDYIERAFNDHISRVEAYDIEDYTIAKYTALGMWDNYPHKDLKEFDEIHSEEDIKVPIGSYILHCKVDGRIKKDGKWWVREIKTSGLGQKQFEGRIDTSAQATGYVYAVKKRGIDVKGVMFDYIRKPRLKKAMSENMHGFGTRIMADYKMRPDYYFKRLYTYRSDVDLKLYEEDMIRLADEMEERKKSDKFYRNQDACWNFNAECPYKKICFQPKPDELTMELYFKRRTNG